MWSPSQGTTHTPYLMRKLPHTYVSLKKQLLSTMELLQRKLGQTTVSLTYRKGAKTRTCLSLLRSRTCLPLPRSSLEMFVKVYSSLEMEVKVYSCLIMEVKVYSSLEMFVKVYYSLEIWLMLRTCLSLLRLRTFCSY